MRAVRDHPLAMTTRFRAVLVLTYAFPADALRAVTAPALALDTRDGWGFVAVALVDMARLRPTRLPPWAGSDAVFVGYRVLVRAALADGRQRRGLQVVRTDVDRAHLLAGTALLTRYDAGLVSTRWLRDGGEQRVRVRSRWRGADLDVAVTCDRPAAPPAGSPFATWAEAAPLSGPLPWTFAPTPDGASVIGVKGVRSAWDPQPVTVDHHAVGLFRRQPFACHEPLLAAAFAIGDVHYTWGAGREVAVRPPLER